MDKTGHELGVSHQLLAIKGRGPHLRAGHPYRLVAVYINPTRDTLRGVMAVMGGLFAPDDIRDWPKIDYANTDYLRDIASALPPRQDPAVDAAPGTISLAAWLGLATQ